MTIDIDNPELRDEVVTSGRYLTHVCHGLAAQRGWWTDLATGERRQKPVPEALMLMVSELGEAMEAHRKGLRDDKLPHRSGLEVELADCIIRIFDFAGGYGLDVAGAVAEKLAFNAKRADHDPKARAQGGGKQY